MQFSPPRFQAPVDIETQIALLPAHAAVKGMFLSGIAEQLRARASVEQLDALGPIAKRRHTSFLGYPYRDFMRFAERAAAVLHPNVEHGEALRRLGQTAYDTLLESHAGRVLFSV